jgi:hypothetical protein
VLSTRAEALRANMRSVVRIREEAGRYTGSRLGCEGPECFVPAHLPTPRDERTIAA